MMGYVTLAQPQSGTNEDHRRAARIRKVRPVAFSTTGVEGDTCRRTVTANVSRGGMLLVSRQDRFPPAGSALTLMPYEPKSSGESIGHISIPGRIVYTRFSPRTKLRFAGLKFEVELNEDAARSIGVDGAPDAVAHTLQALERVEAIADETAYGVELVPAIHRTDGDVASLRRQLDEACTEFFHATGVFLRTWGEQRLRATIAERHALSLAKGAAGIRGLKAEWLAFEQEIPALVDAQLNRDSLWPHRMVMSGRSSMNDCGVWFYDFDRDRPPVRILAELRKLAGFVGRLSIRHGFEDIVEGGDWAPVMQEQGLVTFTGKFAMSDAICAPLKRAGALEEDFRRLVQKEEEADESALRAKALRLWDLA